MEGRKGGREEGREGERETGRKKKRQREGREEREGAKSEMKGHSSIFGLFLGVAHPDSKQAGLRTIFVHCGITVGLVGSCDL